MANTIKTIVNGEVIFERIACDVCGGRISLDKSFQLIPPHSSEAFDVCPTCYEVAKDGNRRRRLESLFTAYPELKKHCRGAMTKEERIQYAANSLTDGDVDDFVGKEEPGLDS